MYLSKCSYLTYCRNRECQLQYMFCDFMKAYDRIDRDFLWKILILCVIGERYLLVIILHYIPTHKSVVGINRHRSNFRDLKAGVRQGCPLAPFLSLMVTQAQISVLKSRGYGLRLQDCTFIRVFFADFTELLITTPEEIQPILAILDEFGDATGQRLYCGLL